MGSEIEEYRGMEMKNQRPKARWKRGTRRKKKKDS